MADKVLIAGAGIGGLVTALRCQQLGFAVEIFEQASGPEKLGAGIQLSPNATRILRALNLETALAPFINQPHSALFLNYQSGAELLNLPLGDEILNRYGAPYWHIHRADLIACLSVAIGKKAIPIHYDTKLIDFVSNRDKVIVIDEENKKHTGQFLVIADGIHSILRDKITPPTPPRFTGQMAWRGTLPSAALPRSTTHSVKNFLGPDKHFVTYPIRQGEMINFVAVTQTSDWTDDSWRQEGDIAQLRQDFADWNTEIQDILQQAKSCQLWGLFERPLARRWYDGRAALVGDAGHAMLPFLAQGAAMAIEDGYVLGGQLARYSGHAKALSDYQTMRYNRVKRVQQRASRNTGLYHAKGSIARLNQRLTLSLVGKLHSAGLDPFAWLFGYDPVSGFSD